MLFVAEKEAHHISILGYTLSLIQIIFLAEPIIPTKKALRKNFNKNGNHKQ